MPNVDNIIKKQQEFFDSGATLDVKFRLSMLKKLYNAIKTNEEEICKALRLDLNKHEYESYICEIAGVYTEIKHMLKNINKYAKKQYKKMGLAQTGCKGYVQNCPYGKVLIVSPWNYPFLLTITPLVDAISAGNTVIIKPSAYSENTSKVINKIISETFEEKYVACVLGGRKENAELFDKKFDFVFFTGSSQVGKELAIKCASTCTPVLLELGGKSPCIVDETADIKDAAKRIVFGKFLNVGQTCVSPDYLLCHKNVKEKLIENIIDKIKVQYGEDTLKNADYGKIINKKNFDRVVGLIDESKVIYGGKSDETTLKIEPTILDSVTEEDKVMQEEIFGPILPIMTYETIEEVISFVNNREKPLALYLFTKNKKLADLIPQRIQYGGGCINDTIIHLTSSQLGFGGVGESGIGAYHGKVGFEAFSHQKSIVVRKGMDLALRYRPYTKRKEKIAKFLLK